MQFVRCSLPFLWATTDCGDEAQRKRLALGSRRLPVGLSQVSSTSKSAMPDINP